MPRPRCCRRIAGAPPCTVFKPAGVPTATLQEIALRLEEFEALRLADHEGLYQDEAARRMGVSRQTFGRIIAEARGKVARALVLGQALAIEIQRGEADGCEPEQAPVPDTTAPITPAPNTTRSNRMKIAIPTRAGQVDEHFGHCESFSIFEIGADKAVAGKESFTPPPQCGCKSNLVGTLKEMGVATLIAGNMGEGAAMKLRQAGIQVIRGAGGPVEAALADFLEGRLKDKDILCAAHGDDGHECGHHHHAPAAGLKPL